MRNLIGSIKNHGRYLSLIAFILICSSASLAWGQDDPYADDLRDPSQISGGTFGARLTSELLQLPARPFDFMLKGYNAFLYRVEEYRVVDKTRWLYDEFLLRGIHPRFSSSGFESPEIGVKLELPALTGLRGLAPTLVLDTEVRWKYDEVLLFGGRAGWQSLGGPKTFVTADIQYSRREEDFYGVGPDTSRGDGTSYEENNMRFGIEAGKALSETLSVKTRLEYKNVIIDHGNLDGKGDLLRYASEGNLYGLNGGNFLILGAQVDWDKRDVEADPRNGYFTSATFEYHEGVRSTESSFFRYGGQASYYKQVFSERQVLAFQVAGVHNDNLDGRKIPFFDLARLGSDDFNSMTQYRARGFAKDRFAGETALTLAAEYRYRVWEYRDMTADAVLFFEAGQVFDEFSNMQLKDFQDSEGVGLRLKVLGKTIFSLSLARSDEGAQFHVRSKNTF